MSAILTIITPELIDRYTDGDLSGKDKRTVETAIATDTRARDAAIQSVCAKVGLSLGLYGPGSYLENRKERDRYN